MAKTASGQRLNIGREGRRRFTLPVDLAVETTAVLGQRGSGKTVTGKTLVEQCAGHGVQVAVIDPTDVWWGITSSKTGKSAGLPFYVMGGPHGHVPLEDASSGAILADFVVESGASVVLSLRHLRKNAQRQVVTAFAEQLYHRKGEADHRTPLLVAIDEASAFVPQRVAGDTARMVGAIEDLVRRGRAAGLGVLLIDQRPASVNKDVLTQLSTLVCHRVTSPQDSKALDAWISQHDSFNQRDQFMDALPAMQTGQAWFWSPALDVFAGVKVDMCATFDSSATPGVGEVVAAPKKAAEVDLDALSADLAAAVERAADSDPSALRAKMRHLEAKVAGLKGAKEADPEAARREAIAAARRYLGDVGARMCADFEAAFTGVRELLAKHSKDVEQQLAAMKALAVPEIPQDVESLMKTERDPRPASPARGALVVCTVPPLAPAASSSDNGIVPARQRILDALARLGHVGIHTPSRVVVAAVAGASSKSSAYRNNLSALRSAGLLDYGQAGTLLQTTEGQKVASRPDRHLTLNDLHEGFRGFLKPAQRRIFDVVLNHDVDAISRDSLAEAAGASPKSSAYRNNLSRLSSLGLVKYLPGSMVVANADLVFPAGMKWEGE